MEGSLAPRLGRGASARKCATCIRVGALAAGVVKGGGGWARWVLGCLFLLILILSLMFLILGGSTVFPMSSFTRGLAQGDGF